MCLSSTMKKYKRCKTSYFSAISAAGLYNGAAGRLNELYSAGLYPVEEESLFFTLFPLFLALGALLLFWLCFATVSYTHLTLPT